jgi:hypothetical protein
MLVCQRNTDHLLHRESARISHRLSCPNTSFWDQPSWHSWSVFLALTALPYYIVSFARKPQRKRVWFFVDTPGEYHTTEVQSAVHVLISQFKSPEYTSRLTSQILGSSCLSKAVGWCISGVAANLNIPKRAREGLLGMGAVVRAKMIIWGKFWDWRERMSWVEKRLRSRGLILYDAAQPRGSITSL